MAGPASVKDCTPISVQHNRHRPRTAWAITGTEGSLDGRGGQAGGTGQALRIAHHYEVPVFNLAHSAHAQRVRMRLAKRS